MCNDADTCSINDVLSTNCLYFALCNLCMSIQCDKQRNNIVNFIIICAGRQRSGRAGVWHQTEGFEEHWLTRSPRRTESRNSAKPTCRGTKCGTIISWGGMQNFLFTLRNLHLSEFRGFNRKDVGEFVDKIKFQEPRTMKMTLSAWLA